MTPFPRHTHVAPSNVSELLLRDVASLVLTTELISSSLVALRPECEFSNELTAIINSMINLCDEGESRLQQPRLEAGIVLPTTTDSSASTLITGFFTRLPSARDPKVFASELVLNLRLLAQHVELKARLAAEEAAIVGLEGIGDALDDWSVAWRDCGRKIGGLSFRDRSRSALTQASGLNFAIPQGI